MVDASDDPAHENVGSATHRRRSGYGAQEAVPTKGRQGRLPYVSFINLRSFPRTASGICDRREYSFPKVFWTPAPSLSRT